MKRISGVYILLLSFTVFFVLSGCSLMQRSPDSGYARSYDKGELAAYRQDRDSYERENARSEIGLMGSQELTGDQRNALEWRLALRRAEKTLLGSREREQYYKYKPLLRNDRERIELIEVGSFEGRERWLRNRGYWGNENRIDAKFKAVVDANDIAIGMPKHAVKESWGEPDSIEVAGNPVYQNERWKYFHQEPSQDGYQASNRIIYFESGQVVGWQTF